MSPHSLADLETLLRAFGVSDKPGFPGDSLAAHVYVRRLALQSPRNPILRVLEQDTENYFQAVRRPTINRRSAFIFQHPIFGLITVLISYRRLKTRNRPSQAHSLSRSSEDNAYEKATVHVFAFQSATNYVNKILRGLAYPFKGHFFDTTDSLFLVESVRMFLVEGPSFYKSKVTALIPENAALISAAHHLVCIQQFDALLDKMDKERKTEILELLEILIKYSYMDQGRLTIEKTRYKTPDKKLLAAQALQKFCFQQTFSDAQSIGPSLALIGPLQLLDVLHILHSAPDGATLVSQLKAEKTTQKIDLERWLESLENAIPEPSLPMKIWHGVGYCSARTSVALHVQLVDFFLRRMNSGAKSIARFLCKEDQTPGVQRKEDVTIFLRPLIRWPALLSAAGFGLWSIYQLGAFVFAYSMSIILLAELFYNSLKFPQANMSAASWTPHEKVLPEFLTILCGVLWLSSLAPTCYAEDSVYVKEMTITVILTLVLQKFFVWLKNVPSTSLTQDQVITGFLFTQFFLACLTDIRNRAAQQEEITQNFGAQNIDTEFSWYSWWLLPKYFQHFQLMQQNDTHVRIMDCTPTLPVRSLLTKFTDVRVMPDCVLLQEFVAPEDDFRANFSFTI